MINQVDFEFIYRAVLRNAIKPSQLISELVGKPEVLYTDSDSVHFRKYTINPKSKMINTPSQNAKYAIPKNSQNTVEYPNTEVLFTACGLGGHNVHFNSYQRKLI